MKNKFDLIILGAGPVGIYTTYMAALYGLKTLLVEKDVNIGGEPFHKYSSKKVHNIPGMVNITGNDLIRNLEKQLNTQKENYELITNTEIMDINFIDDETYELIDKNENKFYTKNIIIAIGNGFYQPKIFSIESDIDYSKFIFYSINEKEIKNDNERIVVLGGGDSAIDCLMHFKNRNLISIHRSETYKANPKNLALLKELNNIEFIENQEIINIREQKIILNNGREIEFDKIFVFYGSNYVSNYSNKPNWWKFSNSITTNEFNETEIKNIYAAGDAVYKKHQKNNIITGMSTGLDIIFHIIKKNKKKVSIW